jgi:hypothetical protein
VWAVNVDKGGNGVLGVLDLGKSRGATTILLVWSFFALAEVVIYACASVSNCLVLMMFTCTNLLRALLGAAGSNVGVRHGSIKGVWVTEGLQESEMDVRS